MKIVWEDSALKLLETRDRYTRNAIREEFGRNPEKDMIRVGTANSSFLTPVSNNRFSVIWRLDDKQAVVLAVLPLTNLEELRTLPDDNRKQFLEKVVKSEAKEDIEL
jgi:hypothetical protein